MTLLSYVGVAFNTIIFWGDKRNFFRHKDR